MTLEIRPVRPADEAAWKELFRSYRRFYEQPDDDAAVHTTWEWVREGAQAITGLVAEQDGVLLGIANSRDFARPSTATTGVFLDDLYTSAAARGRGVGTALLERIAEIAHERGASVVRWMTAETNTTAQRLYDAVATRTTWVLYDMQPRA